MVFSMTIIAWTPAMSVGVEALDTDHKTLISLINQLADAIAKGEGHNITASIINGLVDYTEYHFGREEEMMRVCRYADLNDHVNAHRKIVEMLLHLRDAYGGNASGPIEQVLLDFMRVWLIDHILGTDMKYVPTMKGREADLARVDEAYTQRLARVAKDSDADKSML